MSLACLWCKFGMFLAPGREPACAAVPCTLHGGKGRFAPCNPVLARSQPTVRRSERRAARGWTACARAYHRAPPRYGLLRPSASAPTVESGLLDTRPGTCETHLLATPLHPRQAKRVKVRPELPENFPLRGNFPASSDLFPLTRAAEGMRAWQAVRRRAGHGARAAPMPERHSHGRRTTRKVPK